MYNDVVYASTVRISFQKMWAVQFDVTEPADMIISTQGTNLYLKNLLLLSSIAFLEWLDKKNTKKNFKSKEHLFPYQLIQMEPGNPSPTQGTLSELSTGQAFTLSTGNTKQSTHCALQREVVQ